MIVFEDRSRSELYQHFSTTMVLGTVESKKGVENISEILAVEGLDGVGIGLTDLSQSLGVPGQRDYPLVQKSIETILDTAEN